MKKDAQSALVSAFSLLCVFAFIPVFYEQAGASFWGIYTAVILSSAVGALVMAWLRLPLLLAPSLALTVWLVSVPMLSRGIRYEETVLLSLMAGLTLTAILFSERARHFFLGMPGCFRTGFCAGLGAMLILTGCFVGGIIVPDPITFLALGDTGNPLTFFSMVGVFLLLGLYAAKVKAFIPFTMAIIAILTFIEGFWIIPEAPFSIPEGLDRTALAFFALNPQTMTPWYEMANLFLFLLLFLALETSGNLEALLPAGAKAEKEKATLSIYLMGTMSSLIGAPLQTALPESAAAQSIGVSKRALLLYSLLLLLFLFFEPVLAEMASFPAMLLPAFFGGGILLLTREGNPFKGDFPEQATTGVLIALLPLTRDVPMSFLLAVLTYAFLKSICGKARELPTVLWALIVIFLFYILYGYGALLL